MQCQAFFRRIWSHNHLHGLRPFSSAAGQPRTQAERFIFKSIDVLKTATNDPVWSLLPLLDNGPKLPLIAALAKASVSLPEFEDWHARLKRPTLEGAVWDAQPSTLPPWAIVYLLVNKVSTPHDAANVMFDLVMANLHNLPQHLQSQVLLFSSAHLSNFNLMTPLRVVVDAFNRLPPTRTPVYAPNDRLPSFAHLGLSNNPKYDLYSNLFLSSLSTTPDPSPPHQNFVYQVIRSLESSGKRVHPDTYNALLSGAQGSSGKGIHSRLSLANYLTRRMSEEGVRIAPETASVLAQLESAVTREKREKELAKTVQGSVLGGHNKAVAQLQREQLLKRRQGIEDVRSANYYLRLVEELRIRSKGLSMLDFSGEVNRGLQQQVDDTLRLAAADVTLPAHGLVAVFKNLMAPPSDNTHNLELQKALDVRFTTARYAILLQGLVMRKDLSKALKFWEYLVDSSGLPLDSEALAIGARILTTCGEAYKVPGLLKPYTQPALPPPTFEASNPKHSTSHSSSPVNATVIESWMISLRRVNCPDAVFALWDNMYALYGTLHTNRTLDILLQAAKKVVLLNDRSIRTQISHFFKLGRRRRSTSPLPQTQVIDDGGFELKRRTPSDQKSAEDRLHSVLSSSFRYGKKAKYRGQLWRGKRPEDTAREVFLQVMFGMNLAMTPHAQKFTYADCVGSGAAGKPQPAPLDVVKAPARSVRQDANSDAGVVGLGVALPSLQMEQYEWDVGPEMYRWVMPPALRSSPSSSSAGGSFDHVLLEPRAHYPHLTLTDANFFEYLKLLAVTNRTREVALTMAWMRHLRLRPAQQTLAMAMVLWGEVSVESPFVQGLSRLGGGRRRDVPGVTETQTQARDLDSDLDSIPEEEDGPWAEGCNQQVVITEPQDEYERFVQWIQDWIGPERVPREDMLAKTRLSLKSIREVSLDRGPSSSDENDPWEKEVTV